MDRQRKAWICKIDHGLYLPVDGTAILVGNAAGAVYCAGNSWRACSSSILSFTCRGQQCARRRSGLPNLRCSHGAQWQLLQMRELRREKRLLVEDRALGIANTLHSMLSLVPLLSLIAQKDRNRSLLFRVVVTGMPRNSARGKILHFLIRSRVRVDLPRMRQESSAMVSFPDRALWLLPT